MALGSIFGKTRRNVGKTLLKRTVRIEGAEQRGCLAIGKAFSGAELEPRSFDVHFIVPRIWVRMNRSGSSAQESEDVGQFT